MHKTWKECKDNCKIYSTIKGNVTGHLTSMCGISLRGLSAKYAYNALNTACKNKAIAKLNQIVTATSKLDTTEVYDIKNLVRYHYNRCPLSFKLNNYRF